MNNTTVDYKKAMDTLESRFDKTIKQFSNGWFDQATARAKADGQIQMLFDLGFIDTDDAQDLFDFFCEKLKRAAKKKAVVK